MSNLAYINELGIGEDLDTNDTEVESNETTEESQEDLSLDSEEKPSENTEVDTEQPSELDSLKKQIEGMEKRIADKDDFIKELRDESKKKEADKQEVDTKDSTEEEDFWSNPDKTINDLKETVRVQQMQIQETIYANTVDDYWKTVNPQVLQEAVVADAEFADKFNGSTEPYKTAYEYLKGKAEGKANADKSLRETIKQELLAEMGVSKDKKEVPPNINGGSKSSSNKSTASEDGFASVFGSKY